MGFGKLNVWVRNTECGVVDRTGHLHVNDCHGNPVLVQWFQHGHIEVEVPPGCYIVTAGVVYGNIYTDKTMVLVKCGEEICVNLVLTKFSAQNPEPKEQLPIMYYCPTLIGMALIKNALEAGVKLEELNKAIDVIAKAARMDKEKMLATVKTEVTLLEENVKRFTEKEQEEVRKYLSSVKKIFEREKQA